MTKYVSSLLRTQAPQKSYRDFLGHRGVNPVIVAHRGAWHSAPENSIESVALAPRSGAHVAEIDVQRSADGELFVFHDRDLGRMTEHLGQASEMSISELRKIRLRFGNGGRGANITDAVIPTLAQVFRAARNHIYLDVDCKYEPIQREVAAIAHEFGVADQINVKITVEDSYGAQALQELGTDIGLLVMPKVRLTSQNHESICRIVSSLDVPMVEIVSFDSVDVIRASVSYLKNNSTLVWINTLTNRHTCCGMSDANALQDPASVWGHLMDIGVTIFQTDEPEVLARFASERLQNS